MRRRNQTVARSGDRPQQRLVPRLLFCDRGARMGFNTSEAVEDAEALCEFVDCRDAAVRVDREQAIIRGVKIIGLVSRNGRRYRSAALAQAVGMYEGAKVNVNHPKGHA